MKKKYFDFHINLFSALKFLKTYQIFLVVLFVFLSVNNSFAQTISSFSPTTACRNSNAPVIITGTGFTAATAVKFNGVTAAFVINNDTQITATLPAGTTTGTIVVTPLTGADIISSGTFTVNPNVAPSVSILANPVGSICSGTSVTFTATPVNGGSNPTYQWYVAGILVGSSSPTFTTSTLVNGNQVKVEMTSNAICPIPATVTSNILTMTVNPVLTVSVTIQASQTTFCTGTSVTFSINTLTNGGLTPSYQWKRNGSAIGTNTNSFTSSTLSNNDVITLDVTSSAICASPAMVTSNSIQVTVNPNLPASVTIVSSDADNIICAGTSVTFTATPINGGTTPVYQWYVGATPVGSNSTTYITSGLTNGQSVSVVMTSNALCATGSPATSNAIVTTVNPNLPASVTIVSSDADNIICAGTSATFTATPTNGGTTPVYQWYVGATPVGSNSTTYTSSSLTTGQSVTVVMTSNALCETGSPATSNAIVTTVNPNLPASVTIVSSDADSIICAGTIVTFTATPTNGGTIPIYQWYVGATPVGSNSTTYTTSGLTTGQTVTVVMTSNAVCATGSPATSNAIATTVNPNLPASVSIVSSDADNIICAGTSVIFTATPTNGGATPVYQWYVGATPVGSNSTTYTTSGLTTGQSVSVVMTSNVVCATGSPTTSNAIVTAVNPNLPASVTIVSSDADNIICAGTSVTFTATPTNGGTTPVYQWYLGATAVGSNSTTYTTSGLTTGQSVMVVMTSNAVCSTGSPATSNAIVTMVNPNLPVSLDASGSATTICLGTSVTFTATPTNGGATPTYQWKVNGINAGTNSNTFTTTTLTNGQIVTVVLTSSATCATGNPATSAGITMTVNPNLPVSVSIAASATTICTGTSVIFTATPTNGGATPAYQWQVNGVNAGTNSNTFTTSSLTNGQLVTVILTSNASPCATGNPATSSSITMAVSQNPTITLTSASSTTAQNVCRTSPITNTTYAIGGGGTGGTITWSPSTPAGITGSYSGGIFTISGTPTVAVTAGTYTYTVNTSGSAPCANVTATGTIKVWVGNPANWGNGNPDDIKFYSNSNSVCPSFSGLRYTVAAVTNALSYQWTLPTGFTITSGAGTNDILVSANGTAISGVISVIAVNPCGNNTAKTNNITVGSFAAVDAGLDILRCDVLPINLSATLQGAAASITWSAPSGSFNNVNSLTAIYTPAITSGSVTLTAITNDPAGTCPATNDTLIITINQPSVAPTSVSTSASTICNGSSITLTQTGGTLGTGANWKWYSDATFITNVGTSAAANASLTISPAATTTYYLRAESSTGTPCTANVAAAGNVSVTVNQPSVAPTSLNTSASPICNGSSITLTQTGGTLGNGASWKWYSDAAFTTTIGTSAAANASLTISPAATTTYYLRAESSTGAPCIANVAAAGSVTISVNQPSVAPTSVSTSASPICNGSSITLTQTGGTLGTGASWKWYSDAAFTTTVGTSAAANASLTISPAATTTYYLRAESSTGAPCIGNVAAAGSVTIAVNQPSVAPTSVSTSASPICNGSSITLTQTGGTLGTGAIWKWYSDAAFTTTVGTSAAANASLTISPAATTTYYLRAESSTGAPCTANIAATGNVMVTVNQQINISTQPTLAQTLCSGNSASFSVTATGTGLTYQWRKGTTFLSNVGNISGATSANLTINPVLSGNAATDYNVVITGTAPCSAVTSNNSALVVNDAVVITSQPAATQTLCSGGTATLSVNAAGAGLVYQWRKGSTNLVNGTNIAGATLSTLTLSNLQTTDAVNNYNVVITGASPCTPLTSNNSILVINRLVDINTQPSNVGVCVSNPAIFGIVASGDGLTYQWYKGTIGSGVAVVNSANITGATANVLNFAQAALTDDGPYYAIVSGIAPCAAITSNQVTLNVDQSIAITSQPISKTICEDTPNVSFSVAANAGGDPLTYQWRKNSVNIVGATASTFMISTGTLTSAGNYDVVISGPSGYTCTSILSAAAILTINPKPIGSATTQTICSGSSTNVALNSTVSGTTFSWIAAIQTNPTGGTITGFSDSSGNIIAQSLTNTGTSAGTIRYTITPSVNSCIGITFTVDVTVNPAPVGSATAQTICSGLTTSVTLNSTVIGTTYSWTAAIQTSPTAGTITGFSNGTQNTIVQTLNNTGTTAGVIRYTVTPTANSCSGAAFTVDVTVNPNSTIVLSSVSGSDNSTNCVNTVLNISYAIGGGGNNASITSGALPAGVNGSYNSGTRVFTISGTPSAVGTFSYTVTTQGLCSNASLSGSITVNPDSTINLNLGTGSDNQTKCINSAITSIKYTISNGGTNPSIAWNPGPANFIGSYDSAAGVYTISGSSAAAGTFNYTISTAGSCINSSLTGQITVNPNPVGSAVSQLICSGSVSNVVLNPSTGGTTFAWTAASQTTPTGGSISGFGSGSGASIAQTLTNTGTTSGSIRYTVTPTANSCPGSPFTVDVTVNPKPNGSAIAQTVCSSVKTNVPLNSTVSGTTFTWTSAIISMPTGGTISGFNNGTTNTIAETLSNSGTTAGVIRYTVTPTANNCSGAVFTVDVTVNAPSVGGTTTITSTTNPSNVDNGTTKLTDCHSSGGVIRLNGNVGTVVRWETSTNAGGTWIPRGNAGSLTYNYTGITAATIFRAVIQNSSCTIVNSGISTLFIIPNIKPSPVSAIPSTICEGESTQLSSDSGFSSSQNLESGGLFNQANPPGWLVDDKIFPASGDNGVNNEFSETNGNAGDEYDSGDGKFAITRGNRTSVMQTPVFDLIGLTSANLTFDHAYKLDAVNDYAEVKISLDGGLTYTVTLATFNGNTSIKNPFKNSNPANSISLNLNAYLGYSNIKIGFFFYGTVNAAGTKVPNVGSTWAIDNVKIPQAPDPLLTSQWKNLNNNAIISVTNTTRVTVTPPVTTTYEVTSFLNGCTSYGTEGTTYVTVTVNKRPTANIGPDQTICYDGTATFSVALTGVMPWTVTYTNGVTSTTVNNINTNPFLFSVPNIKADVTYTITASNDKNCTPFPGGITGSAKVTVLLGRTGWWTGLVSTDWFDCKNWEQGLPSFTVDANILPTVANGNRLPVIDKTSAFAIPYGGIASAKDMIITTAGSVTMVSTNNSELQISGNWRNSGAFIPGTGTATFNGATANQIQTINAGIKTKETFYNLTTNNSAVAKGISVVDGFELTVLNNLTLTQGDLRLTGEAQLIQAGIAANPAGGSGKLLRDQQGQKNSFNYNYWCSPVSTNSIDYSIGSVMRDGTSMTNTYTDVSNFSPSTISFIDGAYSADGPSSPIITSNRWLWAFNSPALSDPLLNYYQWKYIGSTGSIKVGEGFTMKGTGGIAPLSATQNYVFVGKPNSGTISLSLTKDQTYLIGNPYPSALDADEFIKDNIKETINGKVGRNTENIFNGALYFWDHFDLSNNHYLAEYQGGYATYTLIGGTAAVADSPLTAGGTGSKIPERYIPVGQGFFVDAFVDDGLSGGITSPICPTGCNIIFKNSQRAFVRELSGGSLFMKPNATTKSSTAEIDIRSKIRLGFDSPVGAHRQLLVGVDPNTTNQFDIGYDGLMFDTNDNDMFWEISNSQFVIQGVPNFDDTQILPLGITVAKEGVSTIKIDALENMPNSTKIYLYDNVTGIYHELRESAFEISLTIGEYNNRFSLRFADKTLKVDDFILPENIFIYFTNNTKTLNIKNNFINGTVNKVFLFNLLGQAIANWDVEEQKQNSIQIPIKNVPSGVYFVKVKTTKGVFSKKIIIR
ncbi:PKD-like domain-containing protein [Flavobacterium sp. ZS1P70]|uniref:PKD-like domain-containing protein n=1 Tax=Flavobacterium zhoui TaxID=3230414 RepID=A0ABW6I3Q3_9FLAO